MSDVTQILDAMARGDTSASDELLAVIYQELRRMAAAKMANEPASQTLQPTALVHEVLLRLTGNENQKWHGRAHFFGAAAEAMRRILIDRARQRNALKRSGGWERVELDSINPAVPADDTTLLFVHEALDALAQEDPASAELVKLRFFAGMTNRQAAEALGVSERTAKRYWTFARAWLRERLSNTAAR